MLETLTTKLLLLFFVLVGAVLCWCLFRDKEVKSVTLASIGNGAKIFGISAIPLILLMLIALFLGLSFGSISSLVFLLIGFILPGLISSSGLTNVPKGLKILVLSVVVSIFFNDQSYAYNFSAYLIGLISWKIVDHQMIQEKSSLADFIPSFLWLVGIYWTHTVDPATWVAMHQKLILGALTVAILMRWMQGPYLTNDKLYLKRIGLAVTGGLVYLIYINQLIVALTLAKYAVIAGVGFFLAYLFDAMDTNESCDNKVLLNFKKVLFVGIFTVLISRLFGMLGLIILAMSMLVTTTSGIALVAAAFWGARVLLQAFVFDFNSNMTGINIMHTYVGAAMFAGFFMAIAIFLLIKEVQSRKISTILIVSASLIGPVASVYFLHAEPTSSFFYSSIIACTLLALTASSFCEDEIIGQRQNILVLIPAQLIACGVLTSELIKTGNSAQINERIVALVAAAIIASAVLAVVNFIGKKEALEISPES